MDLRELEKMTVVKLREEAAKFEDVEGTHGMSKEHLIDLLCDKHNIPRKKALPTGIGRRALKAKIRDLKAHREEVRGSGDSKKKTAYRRKLKSARRRLRKVVEKAARGKIKAPPASGAAAPPES